MALGYCQAHYDRLRCHGDPLAGRPPGAPASDPANPSYWLVHERLRTDRGHATGYACFHCAGQAAEWAYDHQDPNEFYDEKQGPYSADPQRYMPLCRPCHRQFDYPIDRTLCAQLYQAGHSSTQIADQLGCVPTTVIRAARAAGVPIRSRVAWRGLP